MTCMAATVLGGGGFACPPDEGVARMRFVPEGKPGEKDLFMFNKFRFELEEAKH